MNDKVKNTIDQLNTWKDAFMNGTDWSFERKLGITEIRDELENISGGDVKCVASKLFSELTENEKKQVMDKIDFYVNFDELYATYEL
jgi:hypothetical protein